MRAVRRRGLSGGLLLNQWELDRLFLKVRCRWLMRMDLVRWRILLWISFCPVRGALRYLLAFFWRGGGENGCECLYLICDILLRRQRTAIHLSLLCLHNGFSNLHVPSFLETTANLPKLTFPQLKINVDCTFLTSHQNYINRILRVSILTGS